MRSISAGLYSQCWSNSCHVWVPQLVLISKHMVLTNSEDKNTFSLRASATVSLQTARCWPAAGCVGLKAAVQFGVVHLGDWGRFGVTYGRRVCTAQEALPQRVLWERLTATLADQTIHDLLLGAHGAKNTLTGHLTVSLLRPVTAVQTWAQTHGILGNWVISTISFSQSIQNLTLSECTDYSQL